MSSPRRASTAELAVLNHPDRRTAWIVVVACTLSRPRAQPGEEMGRRLRDLSAYAPVLRSRWREGAWHAGSPPEPIVLERELMAAPALRRHFDLASEPPLRLLVRADGSELAVAAHHAALDGRGIEALVRALLGGPLPPPASPAAPSRARPRMGGALRRIVHPSDRVAPSPSDPAGESFAVREVSLRGPNVTGKLAEACVAAVGAHNARRRYPWCRVGLTVPIGGPPTVGNVATYRRIDLSPGTDVRASVAEALRGNEAPAEHVAAPRAMRALAPLVERVSDSLLISNLGRVEVPGVERLAFFPVARGRSAVAFGSAAVGGEHSTLTLRARDLDQADADELIDTVALSLRASTQTTGGRPVEAGATAPTRTGVTA